MSTTARPMTPGERYYAFLDQTCPMNIMLVAELDTVFAVDLVEERWREFTAYRVLTRMMATAELTIADGGTTCADFSGCEMPTTQWDQELARESLVAYGLEHGMRCRYLSSPSEGRSRLFLIGHHSVVDGRSGVAELQAFIRTLDGQLVTEQHELSPPAPGSGRPHEWQSDRRALIDLLRAMKEQNLVAGEPMPETWPSAELARVPRFGPMVFGPEQTQMFLQQAKQHGARAFSAMVAGWLVAVAQHVCRRLPATVQLNTPVDISGATPVPDHPAPTAVAVLSHRFRVSAGSPWPLAGQVATSINRSLAAGEGELFFHLTRTDRVTDIEIGARFVAASLAAAPAAVSVTNLGIIDTGPDPGWLRSMCGYQAPTPNQIAFVSGLGYRGQLVNSVSTDDNRLAPHDSAALCSGFRELVRQMSDDEQSGTNARP